MSSSGGGSSQLHRTIVFHSLFLLVSGDAVKNVRKRSVQTQALRSYGLTAGLMGHPANNTVPTKLRPAKPAFLRVVILLAQTRPAPTPNGSVGPAVQYPLYHSYLSPYQKIRFHLSYSSVPSAIMNLNRKNSTSLNGPQDPTRWKPNPKKLQIPLKVMPPLSPSRDQAIYIIFHCFITCILRFPPNLIFSVLHFILDR